MKIFWCTWCPIDPEWFAVGVVDTVDFTGRDHGSYWGIGEAVHRVHEAKLQLRDRLGVEPPQVWQAWAPEGSPSTKCLLQAKGFWRTAQILKDQGA